MFMTTEIGGEESIVIFVDKAHPLS